VHELAKALVVAAELYKEKDAQARSRNVHFDEYVQEVEFLSTLETF
jgi:hypothetical protein